VTDATPADTRTPAEVDADLALKQADLELKQLEAAEKKLSIREKDAIARKRESEAEAYELELRGKRETRRALEAQDRFHHQYYFNLPVMQPTVEEAIGTLTLWSRMDPGCDIEVVFNSPGGSIMAGVALYDFLCDLRRRGHKLTVTAQGIAASMAGVLLQAGDVRRMGRESWVLIHEGSLGAQGNFGEVMDTVEWMKKVQERFLDIFVSRSKLSKSTIKKNWSRKDWWLSSDECLKHGLVDEVL
jgi:ATP-dependent Clp endopeptidase proteolytic subunit ClpP